MWHIVTGRAINIPYLILKDMCEQRDTLPYGSLLTLVFRHFKIPFGGEPSHAYDKKEIMGPSTLSLMGYSKNANGVWEFRRGNDQVAADDAEDEEMDNSALQAQLDEITKALRALDGRMDQFNDRLSNLEAASKNQSARLEAVEAHMATRNTRLDGIQTQLTSIHSLLQNLTHPPPPPPPPPSE